MILAREHGEPGDLAVEEVERVAVLLVFLEVTEAVTVGVGGRVLAQGAEMLDFPRVAEGVVVRVEDRGGGGFIGGETPGLAVGGNNEVDIGGAVGEPGVGVAGREDPTHGDSCARKL